MRLERADPAAVRPEEPDDHRQRSDGRRVPGGLIVHQHDRMPLRAAFYSASPMMRVIEYEQPEPVTRLTLTATFSICN
jgi:hypothetical protein